MIGYRLSRTGVARHPFYITHIGVGLWSLEELCYYVCTNPALVDDTMLNEQLVRWIAGEFRLTTIALSMERGIRNGAKVSEILLPLLRGTGYLDAQELKRYMRTLTAMEEGSASLRLKMKGDALARNRRYGEAVSAYRQAADQAKPEERKLLASVMHNMGTVLMRLLSFEEACSAFQEAYDIESTDERLRTLLLAVGLAKPEEQFLYKAEELGAEEELVMLVWETLDTARLADTDIPEDLHGALENILFVYHQEAGA